VGFGAFSASSVVSGQIPSAAPPAAPPNGGGNRQTGPGGPGPCSPVVLPSRGFEWWKDAEVKRELKLTEDKTRKIEGRFARLENARKPLCDKLTQERARLDQMTSERVADEDAYALQVRQVESLWATWRESRTVMVYLMFRELTQDQYRKLQDIFHRREAADFRGRGPGSPGPGR